MTMRAVDHHTLNRALPSSVGGTWQCANQPVICADAIELS
jgi:hypothetical protein